MASTNQPDLPGLRRPRRGASLPPSGRGTRRRFSIARSTAATITSTPNPVTMATPTLDPAGHAAVTIAVT
ncbi:hypothetical protein [Actinoplanes campanulatus]|uniref:hypothetical protein n=1 Tax=Actinoplanes campanulatus TaxID=113559 RepID=UPI0019543F44|nr:hypothetical protein [Actinoplanes capillaceus]